MLATSYDRTTHSLAALLTHRVAGVDHDRGESVAGGHSALQCDQLIPEFTDTSPRLTLTGQHHHHWYYYSTIIITISTLAHPFTPLLLPPEKAITTISNQQVESEINKIIR